MKTGELVRTLAASLEQAKKKVGELKKKVDAAFKELGKLPESWERAEYERDELQVKQQRA